MKFMWEVLWLPLLVLGGVLGFTVGVLCAGTQMGWIGALVGVGVSQALQCCWWGAARPYYWWTRKY